MSDNNHGGIKYRRLPKILALCLSGLLLCTAVVSVVFLAIRDDSVEGASTAWWSAGGGMTEASPFIINTAADLAGLAQLVNGGNTFHERFIRLGNNITLSGQWVPIGNAATTPFRGHFNGWDQTIFGLSMNGNTVMNGLFGQLGDGANIRNLTISNPSITSTSTAATQHFGALAARAGVGNITIDFVFVMGGTIQTANNASNNHRIGGLIGDIVSGSGVLIRNVRIGSGTTVTSRHTTANNINHTVGGLVGLNGGTLMIRSSEFLGNINTTGNGTQGNNGADGVGFNQNGSPGFPGGNLGTSNVGGFIGNTNGDTQIHNSLFDGAITSTGTGGNGGNGGRGSNFIARPGGVGGNGGHAGTRHVGGFIGLGNATIEVHNSISSGGMSITGRGGQGGRGGTGGNGNAPGDYFPVGNPTPGSPGARGGDGGSGGAHHIGCSMGRLAGGSLTVITTTNEATRNISASIMRGAAGQGGFGGSGIFPGGMGSAGNEGAWPTTNNNPILGSGSPLTTTPGEPQGPIGPAMDAPVLSIDGSTITWNNIIGNNGYYVQVLQSGTWTTRHTTAVNVTSLDLAPLGLGGGTHQVRVITRGITGVIHNSPPSNVVEFMATPVVIHFNFTGGELLMPPQLADEPLPTIHYMNNVWEHRNHEDFAGMTFYGWWDRHWGESGAQEVTTVGNINQSISVWAKWLPT